MNISPNHSMKIVVQNFVIFSDNYDGQDCITKSFTLRDTQ